MDRLEETLLERHSVLETPLRLGKAAGDWSAVEGDSIASSGSGVRPEASLLVKKGEGEQRVWVSNLRAVKGSEALTGQELWRGQHSRSHPTVSHGVPQKCGAALKLNSPETEQPSVKAHLE